MTATVTVYPLASGLPHDDVMEGLDLGKAHIPGRRRAIAKPDRLRYERNLAEILSALGLDLDTPGTRETPRRLLAALVDVTDGYDGDPKLVTSFPTECHGGANCELAQIVEGPIPFFALCEHHALPFFGRAWLGYVAHEEILGISKLTRLVRVLTRRFGVQERMTHQLADSLASLTQAHGVAVYLEAEHLCTQMRGVREHESRTRTTAYRGVYERDASLRAEFRDIAGIGRGSR
ncbi:MAG: GTP cyclohydrolase I [Candidatus Limnocylindrales bacterium]|nr:GTP cyclohydrolase I [Candidatus Limnocylindrales bacterium]